ncbi:peroxiredoxin-like family protein [Pseudoalteromonas sp. G4]|uniref:peroxiredoxin-like family protein n=1 Tax=Pseudoalteromonas sp. G4 TaxID=2992761 RepID=UPI00237DDD62|nr:peroxiredoxin-like family protein [Pseudoalteromonas sp. G4]MDE3271923.1 AhpC/TSA family protein [Pseudoalteromonas sp. G4]
MRNFLIFLFVLIPNLVFAKSIAESSDTVSPLLNGQLIPNINVTTLDGSSQTLSAYLDNQMTILFFYRGGWCPFCNTQMGQLKKIEPKLKAMGYKLVGVSTDAPQDLQKSISKMALQYDLLSDFNSELSQAFGLAFFTDEATTKRYVKRLDLTNPLKKNGSGDARLVLPVPAIYLIDENGLVQFNYVNPNFKVRLHEEVLLKAAEIYQ